jgi:hypothetical protein
MPPRIGSRLVLQGLTACSGWRFQDPLLEDLDEQR